MAPRDLQIYHTFLSNFNSTPSESSLVEQTNPRAPTSSRKEVLSLPFLVLVVGWREDAHNSLSFIISSSAGANKNSARTMTLRSRSWITNSLLLLAMGAVCLPPTGHAFSASSNFHGSIVTERQSTMTATMLTMRKQKASDRRTRRMQRGEDAVIETPTITSSPMALAAWQHKTLTKNTASATQTGGRGRSRKRSNLYNTLSSYHTNFLSLLTAEYRAEVCFVICIASRRKKIPI
jgi:hypothetical protein